MQVVQPKDGGDGTKGIDGDKDKISESEVVDGVYACGDCVSLHGAPKTLFVAQEMAAIVVNNIESMEGQSFDPLTMSDLTGVDKSGEAVGESTYKGVEMRVLHDDMPFPFCASLGPQDGIFAMNSTQFGGQTLSWGKTSAIQKQLIEDTTIAAMKENTLAKALWYPIH